jgi:hypothetical protein
MATTLDTGASVALATRPIVSTVDRSKRRAPITPASLTALAVVAISSSAIVPLSVACLIVSAVVLGLFGVTSAAAPLRRAFAQNALQRARDASRNARDRALGATSFGRGTLAELTRLVDEIERLDPDLAERIDLQAMLDRYVALTTALERASRAVSMSDRVQLERIRDAYRSDPDANAKRLEMCERRLQCHQQCEAKVEWLADESAIVADFIRLVAQRAACPDDPLPDDTIERQLSELEADDAARRQLAAELSEKDSP